MSLNVFELREIDELLRDFDMILWKADTRAGSQFRIRIQVLLKRLEKIMKEEEQQAHMVVQPAHAPIAKILEQKVPIEIEEAARRA